MKTRARGIDLRLLPGENVEWTTRKGFFSLSLVLAFFGMVGGAVLAAFGFMGARAMVKSSHLIPHSAG